MLCLPRALLMRRQRNVIMTSCELLGGKTMQLDVIKKVKNNNEKRTQGEMNEADDKA